MFYFEAPIQKYKIQKYKHTPEKEFYELERHVWKLALKDDSPTEDNDGEASSSQDSREGIKSDMAGSHPKNNLLACVSPSNQDLLPSQEMDNEYLYFPSTEEAIGKMQGSLGGKWLVYGGFSMANQDNLWTRLLPLCKDGVLIGMKASTAIISDKQQIMGGEVILCYTADANDMGEVKNSGDAIRKAIGSKYILFYKTNASSKRGMYNYEGCQSVTSYMHTVKGTFYVRDQLNRWTLKKL